MALYPKSSASYPAASYEAAFFASLRCAANQVEGEVITLLQLMESMFELGFLDVSDMRWRPPTKTFRK